MIDRRTMMAGMGAVLAAPLIAKAGGLKTKAFPQGFIWGAASAGHQVEGNNVNSDIWHLEHVKPTVFSTPSGDANNSFLLWEQDLDLVKGMGLNSYRFSIEWARIEPEPGLFSIAMLDHYKAIIDGCHKRGLKPLVTFNHFASPVWFGAMGGWTNPEAPDIFARFCDKAARALADGIDHAITFNEPNILRILKALNIPKPFWDLKAAMLKSAAKAANSEKFVAINSATEDDITAMGPIMIEGHKKAKQAIKAAKSNLPVGVTLAMFDDQAVGPNSLRDQKRIELYGDWLEAAKQDDFFGVQNYERALWDDKGKQHAPEGAILNHSGAEVYAASLAGAVRYAYEVTGVPIMVTEHGVGTDDDGVRSRFITQSLEGLHALMKDEGVPVKGYIHWTLMDNFEWVSGYGPKFGLVSVDRETFKRTPKPSSKIYGKIAKNNSL